MTTTMKTSINKLYDIDFIFSGPLDINDGTIDIEPLICKHCPLCTSTDIYDDRKCSLCCDDSPFDELFWLHPRHKCPNKDIKSTNKLCEMHYKKQLSCRDCIDSSWESYVAFGPTLKNPMAMYPLFPCCEPQCPISICLLHSCIDARSCYYCESFICQVHQIKCERCEQLFCRSPECIMQDPRSHEKYECDAGLCYYCFDDDTDRCQYCDVAVFDSRCKSCSRKTCLHCKVVTSNKRIECPTCTDACIICSKMTIETCSECDSFMCSSCQRTHYCRRCKK